MRPHPTWQQLQSGGGWLKADRLRGSYPRRSSNTLSSTNFTPRARAKATRAAGATHTRQAGCMAKTDKRRKTKDAGLPAEIERAVKAAEDKKAEDLVVLDLRKAAGFTDYFVICSGTNSRQIRAIADAIIEALAAAGTKPAHLEGYDRSEW